ncbi:MAG: long-chain fatty acid--CoA ligase [Deltaproteobacteria bacterium]|nr:long-chain fatty acid--CoA ligase [Candidatus Zymogenaceae bacterium]
MEDRLWHKAYVPGIPKSIDYEDLTISEFLSRTAKRFPKRCALTFLGKKISYAELDGLANRFANALIKLGVKPGDRVGLLMPNIPQIVISYYGIWRAGAVAVPVNPLYTDREIEHQFNSSGTTAVITLDLLAPRALGMRSKTKIQTVITAHINDYLPFPTKQLYPFVKKGMYFKYEKQPDYYQFLDLMKESSPKSSGDPSKLDELALIPYSGGTTGLAKGVSISHRNISCITQILQTWLYDVKEQPESELAIFPFFHMAGFTAVMNVCIINGWNAILVPRPEPQIVMDMIRKHKPSIVLAVPTIFVGVLALPEFQETDLSFVKGFFSGAAPLPVETIHTLKESTGATIVEGYGMTESTTLITVTPWGGTLKPGSVGVPFPDTDIRIVDLETGEKDLPLGEEGEIIFRGPQLCQGYYNNPEETENSFRDGWFYTGDIGKMDEDGYLYIVDRKKEMIIAGGYNIFPRDIEEVLYEHPKILEACVLGVPHEYRGETVKAFVVLKQGETITEEELDAYCRENLAPYKVPKLYEFREDLPKSAIGKILKKELKESLKAEK